MHLVLAESVHVGTQKKLGDSVHCDVQIGIHRLVQCLLLLGIDGPQIATAPESCW